MQVFASIGDGSDFTARTHWALEGGQGVQESTFLHLIARFRWRFTHCALQQYGYAANVPCPASAGELRFTVNYHHRADQAGIAFATPAPDQVKLFICWHSISHRAAPSNRPWHGTQHSDTQGRPNQPFFPKSSQPSSSGLWHPEPNQASAATTKWTVKPLAPALLARPRRAQGSSSESRVAPVLTVVR
jgi:hypothetical protein